MASTVKIPVLDPLQHNTAIVDEKGRPTPLFMQQWSKSRELSVVVDETAAEVESLPGVYETQAHAAATYETVAHAAATYETVAHAAATYALVSHIHSAADITSGNLNQARLPSGAVTWTATSVAFTGRVLIPDGIGTAPGLAFASDPTTGLFSVGVGTYRFIAGGVLRFAGTTTETIFFGTFRGDGGAIFQQDLKLGYVEAGSRIIAGDYADTSVAPAASIWISNPYSTPAHEMTFISRQGITFRVDSTSMGPFDAFKLSNTGVATIPSAGPHAIGGTTTPYIQLKLTGTFAPPTAAVGLYIDTTYTMPVGGDGYAAIFTPTFVKAASGTHVLFASSRYSAPVITGSGATVTNAATLYLDSAPTGATNNYALWVDAGVSRFDGDVTVESGTQAQVHLNKAGAGSLSVTLLSGPGNFAAYDNTNSRYVWYYEPVANVFSVYGSILTVGTLVTAGAAVGELVIPNGYSLRGVSGAGTWTYSLIRLDANNHVRVGAATPTLDNFTNWFAVPYASAASFIAGSATMNGVISVEGTNNRFVYYSGGARYYLTGTAF